MVEGEDIIINLISPPVIAAVDVRGVEASLGPSLEVEVEATHLMGLDHLAATHLGVIVEAIPEVPLALPRGIQ